MLYLDYNATTPLAEQVLDAMLPYLGKNYGNPSSLHQSGRKARFALHQAREQLAQLVDCQPDQIIFCSGGTEANNLAIKGAALALSNRNGREKGHSQEIVTSSAEHASVLAPAASLSKSLGWKHRQIDLTAQGELNHAELQQALNQAPALVSIMAANNETGALFEPQHWLHSAKEKSTITHTDAVQWLGKQPLSYRDWGVDMLSLSAHKIYGPKGIGALIYNKTAPLHPLIEGGGQEFNLRSGTENLAGIVGFGQAAELAHKELHHRQTRLQELRDFISVELKRRFEHIVIFAEQVPRLPNTLFFALPGIDGETLLTQLDEQGFQLSSGAACGSHKNAPSHVLQAMGVDPQLAQCSLRLSLGGNQLNEQQLLDFANTLETLVKKLTSFGSLAW